MSIYFILLSFLKKLKIFSSIKIGFYLLLDTDKSLYLGDFYAGKYYDCHLLLGLGTLITLWVYRSIY